MPCQRPAALNKSDNSTVGSEIVLWETWYAPGGEGQGLQIGERGTRAEYRSEQMELRRLGTESSPDFLVEGTGLELPVRGRGQLIPGLSVALPSVGTFGAGISGFAELGIHRRKPARPI